LSFETKKLHCINIKDEDYPFGRVDIHAIANVTQTSDSEYTPLVGKKAKGVHEILDLIDDLMHPEKAVKQLS